MATIFPRKAPGGKKEKRIAVTPALAEKIIEKVDPEPEVVKLPPPQPPPALPDESGAGDFERRRIRRRGGRQKTFLTGDLVPQTTKKKRLG